jgi:hypothetical protein
MKDKNYAPVCGIFCGDCEFLGTQCKGCGNVKGKPFWVAQIPSGICPIHDCCSNQKQIEHCGLCDDLPCDIFLELRDPSMNDDEFQKSLSERERNLIRRREIGTESWLFEISGS